METFGIKEKIENLAEKTQDLAETAYKLALIEATEQVTKVVSAIIIISVLSLLSNFLLLFLGFGVAKWIGDMLDDVKMGYFIVGGFYLLLILVIIASSKKVIIPYFRNFIIKKLYD
ncbi:hypothetical protein BH10BAC3_BH10BAC3_14630 [soil metagenome]